MGEFAKNDIGFSILSQLLNDIFNSDFIKRLLL